MHTYLACSTTIHSEIRLPELPPADDVSPDVTIEHREPDSRAAAPLPDGPSATNGYGEVVVPDPDRLVVQPVTGCTPTAVRHLVLGLGFRLLFYHRGHLVVHGCAVAIDGDAVVFFGEPGVGKSTLSAAFDAAGCPILTDDVVVISDPDAPVVHRCFSGAKLDDDTATRFDLSVVDGEVGGPRRQYRRPTTTATERAYPLKKLYQLAPAAETKIHPLGPTESGFQLLGNSFNEYVEETDEFDHDRVSAHFEQCLQLVQSVGGVSRVERAHGIDALSDIVDAVVADLDGTPSEEPTEQPSEEPTG